MTFQKMPGYKIRPLRSSDAPYVWNWLAKYGRHSFGWTAWTLCQAVTEFRHLVAVDENDLPISYIIITENSWGPFIPTCVSSSKFHKNTANIWRELLEKMEKENVGALSSFAVELRPVIDLRFSNPVDIIQFKGRITFLDTLKTLPKGLFNPNFKVYPIQSDRTIEKVIRYDRRVFRHEKCREKLLWLWLRSGRVTKWDPAPRVLSLYAENAMGAVVGYGSMSPINGASIIAPLYAETFEVAKTLMTELLKLYNSTVSPIGQLILHVPSSTNEFIDFLRDGGLVTSITTNQSFSKYVPPTDYSRVYCVASQLC